MLRLVVNNAPASAPPSGPAQRVMDAIAALPPSEPMELEEWVRLKTTEMLLNHHSPRVPWLPVCRGVEAKRIGDWAVIRVLGNEYALPLSLQDDGVLGRLMSELKEVAPGA